MRNPRHDPQSPRPRTAPWPPVRLSSSEPERHEDWIRSLSDTIAQRWAGDLRARSGKLSADLDGLVSEFIDFFAVALPFALSPHRGQVEELWGAAAELYGSLAARRALAVGEAVDEFQLLREAYLRVALLEPPSSGSLPLRETLSVHRMIDRGVTMVTVGHADALFFALLRDNGLHETLDDVFLEEVGGQLAALREELEELQGS